MKETYIGLMERALSAYSMTHIERYFEEVKKRGLTEHGFPRLTANIGILIAHGRRCDLMQTFLDMMEFCCKTIPTVKAANDFSVREIVSCIQELEQSGAVDTMAIGRWKGYLASIEPTTCYNQYATQPTDRVKNWALFTAVSEFFRLRTGIGGSEEFIDTQLASQLQWMDENGMYMDAQGETHHPILYDLAPRGLFSMLLNAGYRGRYYREIDVLLQRAGLLTLEMQSPNGEVAFGGRSNQFVHNEPWMIAIFEYEAHRYAKEGNGALARTFKAAAQRALAVTEHWLSLEPIYHVKNRFPTETRYGCEEYAYFDKYMITVASNLYAAYLLCDDTVPVGEEPDDLPVVAVTSAHFHKLFLKAGGYGLEFDLNADPHYDACGLGRVHKVGAPSAICLSIPCPAEPNYTVDIEKPVGASLCPGVRVGGEWKFATDLGAKILDTFRDERSASAVLSTSFAEGEEVTSTYTVNGDGVKIEVAGDGDIAFMLPVFSFDGEAYSDIRLDGNVLSVFYQDWICRYTADGDLLDGKILAANRNGYYKTYFATAKKRLHIRIDIMHV
ncbi:MAG: hypothetical protein IJW49_03220 [Clostridia bacterium]|nr:hypothetical protein [Clostridia bacterium]